MDVVAIQPSRNRFSVVATIYLLATTPLVFLGYGSDNDTYGVLDAGLRTWGQNNPSMSRHPGYWLYEALVYFLNILGGSLLTNICTLMVSLFIVWRLYSTLYRSGVDNGVLVTLCFALNPYFIIAATSTMDFIWALGLIVLVMQLINQQRIILGGLLAGMAIGVRLASVFTIFGILSAGLVYSSRIENLKRLFFIGIISFIVGGMFYIPSWILVGKNFTFLSPHLGGDSLWTLKMHMGRAIYKPIYLFGLLSFVLIIGLVAHCLKGRKVSFCNSDVLMAAIGGALGSLVLFVMYPLKIYYLLPFLLFSYLAFGLLFRECSRSAMLLLLISVISYSFVSFPMAAPNTPNRATSATIGFSIKKGVLLSDISQRLDLMSCKTLRCWKWQHGVAVRHGGGV